MPPEKKTKIKTRKVYESSTSTAKQPEIKKATTPKRWGGNIAYSQKETPVPPPTPAPPQITNPPQKPGQPASATTSLAILDAVWPNAAKFGAISAILAGLGITGSMLYGVHSWFSQFGPGGSSDIQITMITAQVEPVSTPYGRPGGVITENTNFAQAGNEPIFYYIENAPDESVSGGFKNWASQIESLDEEVVTLAIDQIQKTDTSEETAKLLEKNHELFSQVESYATHASQQNDEQAYYSYIYNHYLAQENVVVNLAFFNEIFEYLLLQTGEGGEINGNAVDDENLRTSRKSNLEKMMQLAVEYKKELITNNDSLDDNVKQKRKQQLDEKLELTTASLEEETEIREEEFPPALEFHDRNELDMLLPRTKSDYEKYGDKNILVDARVYYLLNYIYHVLEMTGEDYEVYKQDWIQEPTTPETFERLCGDKIEEDPESCNQSDDGSDKCGEGQITYANEWLLDNIDNLGVPYKDRAYLKIWMGLDSPLDSDERPSDQQDSINFIQNTHADKKAIDISQIGLYNARLDCAACEGLEACGAVCDKKGDYCCPTEPLNLETAVSEYIPVEVEWSHGNFQYLADNITSSDLGSVFGNTNQISPQSLIGQTSGNIIGNITNLDLNQIFNYFDLTNSQTQTLLTNIGQILNNMLSAQTGLPPNTNTVTNNQNLSNNSAWSILGGNYLNDFLGLNQELIPLLASQISAENPDVGHDILNFSSLSIAPALYNNLKNNLSVNTKQAVDLSFAHIGIQEINNLFGWPKGTVDISTYSDSGLEAITDRLGRAMFLQIEGLPTSNNTYDKNNPKNNYITLTTNILSEITGNQNISNYAHNTIIAGKTPSLNTALQQLTAGDISHLLLLTEENNETTEKIYNYLHHPDDYSGGHESFLREIEPRLDYKKISNAYPDLTPKGIKYIIQQGTNPDLDHNIGLAFLGADIAFTRAGINLTEKETEQLAYLLEYIAIDKSNPVAYSYPIFSRPTQLIELESKYYQHLDITESLPQFRQRLISIIEQAQSGSNETLKIINAYQSSTIPIKATFGSDTNLNQFLTSLNQTNTNLQYTYSDQTALPDPANPEGSISVFNVLQDLDIDFNSAKIISEKDLNCNNEDSLNPGLSQYNPAGSTIYPQEQIYYIYPQIDLAEILVNGIRNTDYSDQTGKFKFLQTTTNVIHQSYKTPVILSISRQNTAIPNTLQLNNNQQIALRYNLESGTSALRLAMANKFIHPGANTSYDELIAFGGTGLIFDSLFSLNPGNIDQNINNLAQIGYISTASRLTKIDLTGLYSSNITVTDIENYINTLGILMSLADNNVANGINQAINLTQQNKILQYIQQNNSIDPAGAISNLQAGNFHELLGDIPLVQKNIAGQYPQYDLETTRSILRNIQRPTVDSLTDLTLTIITNTISSQTGIDPTNAFNIISQDLGGFPPQTSNLYLFLSNSTIQNGIFTEYDSEYIKMIFDINKLIAENKIDATTGNGFIGQYQLFSSMVGATKINRWIEDQGGIADLVRNKDINTINQELFNYFKDDITTWLAGSNFQNSMQIDDLEQLISGNLENFINHTAANSFNNQYLTDYQTLSGDISNLLNGQISMCGIINLFNSFNSFFNNPVNFLNSPVTADTTLNNLQQFYTIPDSYQTPSNIGGGSPNPIFDKCKQKIARDNIVHLTDIITSFHKNKRTLNIYGIDHDSNGELLDADKDSPNLPLSNFYPHQVFSDFVDEVLDVMAEQVAEYFNYVWPKDEKKISEIYTNNDIWKNDCSDRENDYLATCKQYIHVSF